MFAKLLLSALVASATLIGGIDALKMTKRELKERQFEAAKRWHVPAVSGKRATGKNITFSNPKASEFFVDGSTIPEVDFDVGPSWSGLIPISSAPNETRKLFFWFFPPGPEGSLDDIIFWTNGGPGCSSLEGFLQENGPFSWGVDTAKPIPNEFSWTNLSSMLWVEQPVGTGFSQGVPNIRNDVDLAEQLVGFMQQFLDIFSELKNKKLYITGESYAGTYVPYIANYIYENPTALDLSLQGIWISDPSLSWDVVQEQIPAVNFVHKYDNVFSFNQSFMAELDVLAVRCNYADYFEKFVTYPPTGLLPLPGKSTEADRGCDAWDTIFDEALNINPAFNIYRHTFSTNIVQHGLEFVAHDLQKGILDIKGIRVRFCAASGPPQFSWTAMRRAGHTASRAITPLAKDTDASDGGTLGFSDVLMAKEFHR